MFKIPLFKELKTDQWVKPFFKQYKVSLVIALFLGFMTFFSASALMFNSGYLISKSASLPSNILLVYVPIVLTRAFGIGRPVFRYIERLTSHNWVLRMTSQLRLKLYHSLESNAIFMKRDFRLGDVMGLLAEDINYLQNLYLRTIFPTIIAWILYSFIIIATGFFSLWFALMMLLYLAIMIFVFPLWSILANGARQTREKELKNHLCTDLTDNVLGISDWIFSQRGQEYVALHERSESELMAVQKKIRSFDNRRALIVELVFGFLAILVIILASNQFIGHRGGEANWIAAFVLTVFPLSEAFAGLSAAVQETNKYSDSIHRLNELSEMYFETTQNQLPNKPYDFSVKNSSFQYKPQEKWVLHHLDLDIKEGEKIAILGRSGSGKSTLASLLRGDLKASQGEITLGGVDVSIVGDCISNYIGVIQQAPYLFNTTLLNNIRIGNQDASEEDVWKVLERVVLKEMVTDLSDGLYTMVDEAGLRFSGGERHRIALARILLKDVPIVILDEPTVGLDPITEQALLRVFMKELEGKTLVWITHHLKGIEHADRILFIENGQLELEGSPQELSQSSQRYRQLKAADDGDL
ncbi:Cysteine ABC transporter ATP-binding protein [Streptococcus agalactiae]|nr:Cysteine ABC transporter ATP-binding protein [Streptococcus agalactiae]ANI27838.1 thiol reductant ABC exporter subunit CydC [Streptococcus agalactiae]APO42266.1 thiol reductant ABC exporter subunit CydC [Streptococcus agalactiae]AUO80965.1 ABC transporter, ATP-binding protein CydC [Streptococcus agalactiae]AUO82553.1 ABC transporter permease protein CydD [Streptococcus agalactiae]